MRQFLWVGIFVVLATGARWGWAEGDTTNPALPTMQELQALYDAGQYKETLQGMTRVLGLSGKLAEKYDRYQLQVLRGNALLQTNQAQSAQSAFQQAQKEAQKADDAAVAQATVMLIQRSNNNVYTPKAKAGTTAKSYSILDQAERKEAFKALFAEELAAADPKIKAAKQAKSLPPLVDFAKAIAPVRALEIAATGDNAQTKALLSDLGDKAKTLIDDALTKMEKDVANVDRSANEWLERTVPNQTSGKNKTAASHKEYQKRGLNDSTIQTLENVMATCDRLPGAVKDLSQALSLDVNSFKSTLSDAAHLRTRAQALRKADYSQTSTTPH